MEKYSKKIIPQAFRIAWNSNGDYQGCDFSFKEQIFEDGVFFGEKSVDTFPVEHGVEDALHAMKLSDVMDGINPQLILNVNQLQDDKKILETELKSVNNQLSETSNLLTEANTEIEQLKAELEKSNQQLVEVNKVNEELIKNIPVSDEIPE